MDYYGASVDHQIKVVDARVVHAESALKESVAPLLLEVKDTDPCPVPDDGETRMAAFIDGNHFDRLDIGIVGGVHELQIYDFLRLAIDHVYLRYSSHSYQVLCVLRVHRAQRTHLILTAIGLFLERDLDTLSAWKLINDAEYDSLRGG